MIQRGLRLVYLAAGLFLLPFILVALFYPRYEMYFSHRLLLLGLVVLILLVVLLAVRVIPAVTFDGKLQSLALFIGILGVCAVVGFSLQIKLQNSGWDAGVVFTQAVYNVNPGAKTYLWDNYSPPLDYLQLFPNNMGGILLLTAWFKLFVMMGFGHFNALAVLLNVLFVAGGILLLYKVARRVAGERAALFALVASLFLIGASMWVRTFYSDTVGVIFPIGLLYLLIKITEATSARHRLLLVICYGLIAGIGLSIKPTTIIVTIAAGLVAVWYAVAQPRRYLRPVLVAGTITLFLTVGTAYGILWAGSGFLHVHYDAMPETHYFMMGLTESNCDSRHICTSYGGWNSVDANMLGTKFHGNTTAYSHYALQQGFKRVEGYGVWGYPKYLLAKGAWVIGDGRFSAYYEGNEALLVPQRKNPVSTAVAQLESPHLTHGAFIMTMIAQALWLGILLLALVPLARVIRGRQVRAYEAVVYLSVVGIVLFLLLFEARARYVYLYAPLVILAASMGVATLEPLLRRLIPSKHSSD